MALRKYISGFLLALLILFANNGAADSICTPSGLPSYRQDTGRGKSETVLFSAASHHLAATRRHSFDGDGHGVPHHKKKLCKYIFGALFSLQYECSKATIGTIFRRLLEYHTFVQVTSLFPKHGFW